MLFGIFKKPGKLVDIVTCDRGTATAGTAASFIGTYSKLVYLFWLLLQSCRNRIPVEPSAISGQIAAGTLALNFNAVRHDILAYILDYGYSDNTPPGPIVATHSVTDTDGQAKTYTFEVAPNSKQVQTLYLANSGVGAKYIPCVDQSLRAYAVAGGASVATSVAFVFTGPNDVRVSVLPITSVSVKLNKVALAFVQILWSYLKGAMFSKKAPVAVAKK